MDEAPFYKAEGYCPICEAPVIFESASSWFRDHLQCSGCKSVVRERALALAASQLVPNWRNLSIHESSPVGRGISLKFKRECRRYIASQYFPDQPLGAIISGFRNENLERQTFPDTWFDLVVSLDVMEHVFDPGAAYREICRTLRPNGYYIHTFPIIKSQVAAVKPRAVVMPDGQVEHLEEPQYHGNPISDSGSLVTQDYGYDIHQQIAAWADFDVVIARAWDRTHGIIGDYSEIVVCRKRA